PGRERPLPGPRRTTAPAEPPAAGTRAASRCIADSAGSAASRPTASTCPGSASASTSWSAQRLMLTTRGAAAAAAGSSSARTAASLEADAGADIARAAGGGEAVDLLEIGVEEVDDPAIEGDPVRHLEVEAEVGGDEAAGLGAGAEAAVALAAHPHRGAGLGAVEEAPVEGD